MRPTLSPSAYPKCALFTLPAELRNTIYALTFTSFSSSSFEIPLSSAHTFAPPKNPLQTCQRFYREANGIYKAATRSYWSETTFTIDAAAGEKPWIDELHITHVTQIEIHTATVRRETVLMSLKPSTLPFAWSIQSGINLAWFKQRLNRRRTEVVQEMLEERSLEDGDVESRSWIEWTPKWVRKELEVTVEVCSEVRW